MKVLAGRLFGWVLLGCLCGDALAQAAGAERNQAGVAAVTSSSP